MWNFKETLMRLFGRRKPSITELPTPPEKPANDELRQSFYGLIDEAEKAHEEKLNRTMEHRVGNGASH